MTNKPNMTVAEAEVELRECVEKHIGPALAACVDAGYDRRTVVAAVCHCLAIYVTGPDESNRRINIRRLREQINEYLAG